MPDRVREKMEGGNVTVSETDRQKQNRERKLFAVLNRYSSFLSQIEGKKKRAKVKKTKTRQIEIAVQGEKEKHN